MEPSSSSSSQHRPKLPCINGLLASSHLLAEQIPVSYTRILFISAAAAFSLALNAFLLHRSCCWPGQPLGHAPEKGWAEAASRAAEEASLFACSGHGDAYVDTSRPRPGSRWVCECHQCFHGPDCADPVPNCEADVDSGTPLFLEPFWRRNAEASAVVIPGWYRMGYQFVEGDESYISPALEREIRRAHELVGNAVTQGRYIVIGTGSMQLLNAAVSGLAPNSGDRAARVVTAVPFYGAYQRQTELFQTSHYTWKGDVQPFAETKGHCNDPFIEFVNSPNNPDGTIRQSILNGSNAFSVHDHAYYWPHYTPITKPADEDVMLFTLSKLTGHAGTRIGWAIIKDEYVYKRVFSYVISNILSVSHESQFRATQLLRFINDGYMKMNKGCGDNSKNLAVQSPTFYAVHNMIFHYGYAKMRYRWETLSKAINGTTHFKLMHHFEPEYCLFFKTFTIPYPAYAWIQCNQQDENCSSFFQRFGIRGRQGSVFGESESYARFSLLNRDSTFENLVKHLTMIENTQ